jgi:hypothetical protein
MTRRILTITSAALAAAALAAPASLAATAAGTYRGTVNQSDLFKNQKGKISLTVHGGAITKIIVKVGMICQASDGSQSTGVDTYSSKAHIRIHGGRFSWEQKSSSSDFAIKGRFSGAKVSGTVFNQFTDSTYGYCTTYFHEKFSARR